MPLGCCDSINIDANTLCALLAGLPTAAYDPNNPPAVLAPGVGSCRNVQLPTFCEQVTTTPAGVPVEVLGVDANGDCVVGPVAVDVCAELGTFPVGIPLTAIGIDANGDCVQFTPTGPGVPVTVTDTPSVNLTLLGQDISANVNVECGLVVLPTGIAVDTTGTWGAGDLNLPGGPGVGAPIYCNPGDGIRTMPPSRHTSRQIQGLAGNFGGAPAPAGAGAILGSVVLAAEVNNTPYEAYYSEDIRFTMNVQINPGNTLQYQIEKNGVPVRFGQLSGTTATIAQNVYDDYDLPELEVPVASGAARPAVQYDLRVITTVGLGAFIFDWTIFAARGPLFSSAV